MPIIPTVKQDDNTFLDKEKCMKLVWKLIDHSCRTYTVTSVLLLLLQPSVTGSFEQTMIEPMSFLMMLPFAVGIALANACYTSKMASYGIRLLVHFVLCVLSAFLFLYLPGNAQASGSGKLLIFLFLSILYCVVMGLYLVCTRARRRKQDAQQTSYQNVFKK